MNISCVHCGQQFLITAQQLGGSGYCPHCGGEISLPGADDAAPATWSQYFADALKLDNWLSGFGSMVFHLVLVLVLALFTYGGDGVFGEGEDVGIGNLPFTALSDSPNESLNTESAAAASAEQMADEALDIESPISTITDKTSLSEATFKSPNLSGGATGSFDMGTVGLAGGGSSGSFEGMVQQMQRHGLDIVLVFDSTGSMSGEINNVKSQIRRIGTSLKTLIPKVRFSVVTYRDERDEYLVKGIPLTGDLNAVEAFLSDIRAGGGGDFEEAVQEGLKWAVTNNRFQGQARKVILLFGDAPPHAEDLKTCLTLAADFHSRGQQMAVVSTVTCHSDDPLPEFVEIAQMGGGEAFLTRDERQIMTQLMVLVFGGKHRAKVVEALKLIDR